LDIVALSFFQCFATVIWVTVGLSIVQAVKKTATCPKGSVPEQVE